MLDWRCLQGESHASVSLEGIALSMPEICVRTQAGCRPSEATERFPPGGKPMRRFLWRMLCSKEPARIFNQSLVLRLYRC
jgi:hypothetical protein